MGTTAEINYKHFFKYSRDLLCIAGTDGYFKELNPTWTKVLGWSEEELLSRPFVDFIHKDDLEKTFAEVEKLAQGEPTIYFENRYFCKDGNMVWLAWTCTPSPSGALYATARDITNLKQLQEELRENNLELRRSNEELDKFAYMVSHDLKAPLRAISSLVEFIADDIGEQNYQDVLQHSTILKKRAKRMGDLIEDVLEYAKIGRQEIRSEVMDPNQLISDAIEYLAPPAGIKLEIAENIPSIKGKRIRFQQVIANLVGNSVKYMEKEEGKIKINWKDLGDFLEFSVQDDGPGIEEKYHEKIFGMFQRLVDKESVEGTGIGLPMVKKIVEDMGGRIWVNSSLGEGTTMNFTWPKKF